MTAQSEKDHNGRQGIMAIEKRAEGKTNEDEDENENTIHVRKHMHIMRQKFSTARYNRKLEVPKIDSRGKKTR